MINEKVNIFEFATKELSQDAVFMYLFDCFNSNNSKEQEIGKDFLELIMNKTIDNNSVSKVIIKKQYNRIDVLALVEYNNRKYDAIIVEDKTYSSEHDNQLEKYYNDINVHGVDSIDITNIYGVYFKLGELNIHEKNALKVNNFEYENLAYNKFLGFLTKHQGKNLLLQLIYEFYNERLSFVKTIDEISDFSSPEKLDFEEVLSNTYSQYKYFKWIINQIIENDYHEENQYSVMNFGKPCTQYRFVFTQEDKNSEKWRTNEHLSEYCYFFRIDKNSNGWYISINQYGSISNEQWEAKKEIRDKIREEIRPIAEGINFSDNRGKKESKICLVKVDSFEKVKSIIPALKEIYNSIINYIDK